MQIIKQTYYEKIIFPQFISNVEKVWKEKNILVRLKFDEDKMTLYYIINDKIIKIEKIVNENIYYEEIILKEIINSHYNRNLPLFIKDLKLNAEIVSSQNMIDFISHSFKDAIKYYKLSRKDYELIYQAILKYNSFFQYNTPALVIHNEGIKNKWID